jgi:hypothetical protein
MFPALNWDQATWRKSSRSAGNGACIEIAIAGRFIGVRDSKDRESPILEFTPDSWSDFVHLVTDQSFELKAV